MANFKIKDEDEIVIDEDAVKYWVNIMEKNIYNIVTQELKKFERDVLNPKLRDLALELRQYADSKVTISGGGTTET